VAEQTMAATTAICLNILDAKVEPHKKCARQESGSFSDVRVHTAPWYALQWCLAYHTCATGSLVQVLRDRARKGTHNPKEIYEVSWKMLQYEYVQYIRLSTV
jgi:hypothetical protein